MKSFVPVLSMTGSDNTSVSGIQSDIRTISDLGGYPLTAVTAVTIQDNHGIQTILDLPQETVVGQVKAILQESIPKVAKIGMLRDPATVCALRDEIISCRHIVLAPGIINSHGTRIMSDEALAAWKRVLIPEATLLLVRCEEAELLLGHPVSSDDEMLQAAQELTEMGAQHVLLRGGKQVKGQLTALYYGEGRQRFFVSHNTEGWQRHGVGGALSAAIATQLALGDGMDDAISHAHAYIHSQIVYAVSATSGSQRMADIYNQLMSEIALHYREAHDVNYYADKLAITPRYLSQATSQAVGKSPKMIITDYLMKESVTLLSTTRLTVGEISDRLGFSSQALFCKFFHQHEHCSPMTYRSRL